MILRSTKAFALIEKKGTYLIKAKKVGVSPKKKTIRQKDAEYLLSLPDNSFDGACVLDFAVGVFTNA